MIQTHMLKLDPPYQIIHAGGEVGLHIATLVEHRKNRPFCVQCLVVRWLTSNVTDDR